MASSSRTKCLLNKIFIFVLLMAITKWCTCSSSNNSSLNVGCKDSERKALLNFKHSLSFFSTDVSSLWEGEDCCKWSRVSCDPTTGDVVKLQLQNGCFIDILTGFQDGPTFIETENLESALQHLKELKQLEHLDLSCNYFTESRMPKALGSMQQLRYLNLSFTYFSNGTLDELSNLTHLQYLDLYYANLGPNVPLGLGKLQSLVHLDLSGSDFSRIDAGSISGLVHNLCSLGFLRLSENKLQGNLLEPLENSSTICTHYDLEMLDLSTNYISGAIPAWLGEKFQSLKYLYLNANQLSGEIPASLGNLSVLKELFLSSNKLTQISSFLKFPTTLDSIYLSNNNLTGQIPKSLGNLSKLQSLDISSNPLLNGTVLTINHFTSLSNLRHLDLSDTFLTLKLPVDWVPPFQLRELGVGSCKINGNFPQWLQTQKHLNTLNLSNAGISGAIPKWFHTMQRLHEVDLSYNQISGSPVFPINFIDISFSNNTLSGPLFSIDGSLHINITYPNATSIDLSSNSISGLLPEYLDRRMPNLGTLVLSNNQIYGPIPMSICQLELNVLDLQKNRLSGTIPKCLGFNEGIEFVSLSFNNLRGNIPGFGPNVRYVHLNDNKLSGQLPPCFENNNSLQVLDVGGNELSGKMPAWLTKERVPDLEILRLRGNKFDDSIPQHLCSLSTLQILDLSHNHLSGTIPYCLSNFTAMNSPQLDGSQSDFNSEDGVKEVIQGIERAYTSTLKYLVDIDLSCNELVGNIPDGITNLSYLLSLNLSNNHLSGVIPQKIGAMKSLIAIDFSKNRLGGTIPTSMAKLNGLSYLNLSYNNFSGQIPTGDQLQTLVDPSIYAGNPFLCGDPLPKKCKTINGAPKGSENKGVEEDEDEDTKHETMWFYLVVMSGFATGFWGVVGSLFLKRRWRQSLFRRVEDAYDWFYVAVAVRMARLKKKWDGSSD